jgi:hypothetical protein
LFDDSKKKSGRLPTDVPDIDVARLHIMSKYVLGFKKLGNEFVEDYKQQSIKQKYHYYEIEYQNNGKKKNKKI